MKKTILTGIAALFLATWTGAVAAEIKVFEAQKTETGEWGRFVIIRGEERSNKEMQMPLILKQSQNFPNKRFLLALRAKGAQPWRLSTLARQFTERPSTL